MNPVPGLALEIAGIVFHGWMTLTANCYLLAGLAFLLYLGCREWAGTGSGPAAGFGRPVPARQCESLIAFRRAGPGFAAGSSTDRRC